MARKVQPPIRSIRSRVSGSHGEDGMNGRAKPSRSEEAIQAQVRHGVSRDFIHSDKDCLCCGGESRSVGLVPCFHSMSVETPSPSWS